MRRYWTEERRFPAALADEFKIGAAPAEDGGLAARLWKRKYSEEAFRQCGLFFIREGAMLMAGTLRPRFRGRLMIPIRDHQGRIVAFTARQTALTPADDPAREAKYVNSPETPIFTKGNLLFNLDRARTAVGEGHPFVLVEGQLDALRCWQVGLKTAVAPQGTSITESQLALLRRYHPQIECFFDSDAAGQKAALRLLPMALKSALEVRFLNLAGSDKVDPDLLFLERGLAAYADVRQGASSAMAFACRAVLPEGTDVSAEQKSRASQAVLEMIAAAESEVSRAEFIREAAVHLHLPAAALEKDFQRLIARRNQQAGARAAARGPEGPAASAAPPFSLYSAGTPEQDLLTVCLHYERLGKALSAALPDNWIDLSRPPGVLLNRFLNEFAHDNWPGRDHLDTLLETADEKALIASLLFDAPQFDDPLKIVQEGLVKLRDRALVPRLREIELALATEPGNSKIDPNSLLIEKLRLQRQLRQPLILAVGE